MGEIWSYFWAVRTANLVSNVMECPSDDCQALTFFRSLSLLILARIQCLSNNVINRQNSLADFVVIMHHVMHGLIGIIQFLRQFIFLYIILV